MSLTDRPKSELKSAANHVSLVSKQRLYLADIAIARSGDKGNRATLGVVVLDPADYTLIEHWLTAERVAQVYRGVVRGAIVRYPMPQLGALHFVMDDALAGGVTRSLGLDAHGKTLASAVLALELPAS